MSTTSECVVCGATDHKRVEFAFGIVTACPQMEPDCIRFGPDTFTIERTEFYRLWDGKVHNEYMPTFDRYDWHGRHYRHYLGIGWARVDNGDPGDEHDGE